MKIIFSKKDAFISRSTKKGIKREIKKELVKQFGRHVSSLNAIAIDHPTNPKTHGYAIYFEAEGQTPKEIFPEIIQWGTNYFFGEVIMKRSQKKFFFLADIQNPLPIGNEKILLEGLNEIKVYIKIKE